MTRGGGKVRGNHAPYIVWAKGYDPFGRVVAGVTRGLRGRDLPLNQSVSKLNAIFLDPNPKKTRPELGRAFTSLQGAWSPRTMRYSLAATASQFTNLSRKLVK